MGENRVSPLTPVATAIAAAAYINLVTFRRDGREVSTPVWLAAFDGRFYAYAEGGSGKVKRIRATARVRFAPCNFRGKVLGESLEGVGRVVSEPELAARFYRALAEKYGWQYRLGTAASFLSGKLKKRVVIELTPGAP